MIARSLICAVLVASAALPLPAQTPVVSEKDVRVFGFKLHYREAGQGKPIVLLHGLGGDGSRWEPNIAPLAADFRVIALDQIGFGQSDKPLANYHNGMLSEFLVEFLRTLGIQKASLVGNSMGGYVAAYTAVHYPGIVDRLVLVDGGGYKRTGDEPRRDPHVRQIQNGATREETRELFLLMLHDKSLVTDQMVDDNFVMRLRSSFTISKWLDASESGLGGITAEEMRTIKAPTLILWGKYDELAGPPERTAERLQSDIDGSRLVVIDNAGHLPQLEQPEQFNKLVREFLKAQITSRAQ
jgi:2-hydroxy-6-oxonona-2,4-dienedioate hydrolase